MLGVLVKKNRGFPCSQSMLIADSFLQSVVLQSLGAFWPPECWAPQGRGSWAVACRPHRGFREMRLGKALCSISCSGVHSSALGSGV